MEKFHERNTETVEGKSGKENIPQPMQSIGSIDVDSSGTNNDNASRRTDAIATEMAGHGNDSTTGNTTGRPEEVDLCSEAGEVGDRSGDHITGRTSQNDDKPIIISDDESSNGYTEAHRRKRRREFPGFDRNYYARRFQCGVDSLRTHVDGYMDRLIRTRDRVLEIDNIGEESDEFFRKVITWHNQFQMIINKMEKDFIDTNRFQL